jgi:hypothetical protein
MYLDKHFSGKLPCQHKFMLCILIKHFGGKLPCLLDILGFGVGFAVVCLLILLSKGCPVHPFFVQQSNMM